jgi:hypothetical protein
MKSAIIPPRTAKASICELFIKALMQVRISPEGRDAGCATNAAGRNSTQEEGLIFRVLKALGRVGHAVERASLFTES